MGLVSSVFAKLFGKKPARIFILGPEKAGKTTFLYKIKLNEIVVTIPTTGFNVEDVRYKNNSFVVWDMVDKAPLVRHYLQNTDGIIFVIDSTDRSVIEEAEQRLHRLLCEDDLKDSIFLILANKQDLPDPMSTAELTDKLKLNTIKNRKWIIQPTSVVQGTGLYEGLDWLSKELATSKGGSKGGATGALAPPHRVVVPTHFSPASLHPPAPHDKFTCYAVDSPPP